MNIFPKHIVSLVMTVSNQPGGCAPIDVADAPLLAEAVAECSRYKHAVIKSLWVRPVHVIIPFG